MHFLKRDISTKEVIVIYCVFNENLITSHAITHVRQLREDRDGNRYPLTKDKKARIRKENGSYHGIINGNETIAISDDVETVHKRLKRVDHDIDIVIRYKNRSYETIESYYNSLLPRVYRITSSNTNDHGFIIAMNSIKNNNRTAIEIFYSLDELYNYFNNLKRQNYYVYIAHLPYVEKRQLGGIDTLDVPTEFKDVSDLRATIEANRALTGRRYNNCKKEKSRA